MGSMADRQMRKRLISNIYGFPPIALALVVGCLCALMLDSSVPRTSARIANPSQIIRVPPGGNLQIAIDRAAPGSTIEVAAGAEYGAITLPVKAGTSFITIRSSAHSALPVGKRVSPSDAQRMAKIVTRTPGVPAVKAARGAHHYRFIGIEFFSNANDIVYNLVEFGGDHRTRTDVPSFLEIERSIVRAGDSGVVRRGLALNSSDTVVRDSLFLGFAFPDEETQGICGWTGTRNVKILNNYIEGGAENIMFGGGDPASADLVPGGIEIRLNHLKKPAAWKARRASMKTIFELKNARGVLFSDNFLEDNWLGSAMRITVRNQDGRAPFSTIEDVVISNNVISGAGDGINILGTDDTYRSAVMKKVRIAGNLFLRLGDAAYQGNGYFIQISEGEDIVIERNTSFNSGNTVTFYGKTPRRLVIRDNIIGHGEYGVHGLENMQAVGASIFSNNLIFNSRRVATGDLGLAPGSILVQTLSEFGFTDAASGNYKLPPAGRFKNVGAEIDFAEFRRRVVF